MEESESNGYGTKGSAAHLLMFAGLVVSWGLFAFIGLSYSPVEVEMATNPLNRHKVISVPTEDADTFCYFLLDVEMKPIQMSCVHKEVRAPMEPTQ